MSDISVIIPTFNRAHAIRDTLDGLTRLDTNGLDWEVIVVDNNSCDETRAAVESFVGRLPVRYLFEPRQGKNYALNAAIELAMGEILVFADDDITPDHSWLIEIANATSRWPDYLVFGGRIEPAFPEDTLALVREANFSDVVFATMCLPQSEGPFPEGVTPNGPNCWVRRRVFQLGWRYNNEIGPKGTGRVSGSEWEFFLRLRSAGIEPVYVPSATVLHRVQPHQTKTPLSPAARGCLRAGHNPDLRRRRGLPDVARCPPLPLSDACRQYRARLDAVRALRPKRGLEHLMRAANHLGAIREARTSSMQKNSGAEVK